MYRLAERPSSASINAIEAAGGDVPRAVASTATGAAGRDRLMGCRVAFLAYYNKIKDVIKSIAVELDSAYRRARIVWKPISLWEVLLL